MKPTTVLVWIMLLGLLIAVAMSPRCHAGELYVQAGMAHQFSHPNCVSHEYFDTYGHPVYLETDCLNDRIQVSSHPLAHLEFGLAETAGRYTFTLYARHESVVNLRDYGVNQLGVSMRVRLWRWGT